MYMYYNLLTILYSNKIILDKRSSFNLMMSEEFLPPQDPNSPLQELLRDADAASAHEETTEEEKKTLWRKFIDWLKQLPTKIKNMVMGIKLDIFERVALDDLLSICKVRSWYNRSVNGTVINCPTELKPGDHIAVKTKRSKFWWNHMIVTEEYIDGFDVICPCKPALDPNEVKLELDYFCPLNVFIFI